VEFRILGPLEVIDEDRSLELGGSKQRSVLAMLALRAGRVVSTDTLIDGLWGDAPPATASKSLQVYVSRLRKALGEDVIVTRTPGYLLDVRPESIDVAHVEALLEQAHGEAPPEASSTLSTALALWRGPTLEDLAHEPFAQVEIGRLEELRLGAVEDRIDADLDLGKHASLVPELETLSRRHPYRERLIAQRMLALYRSGRQTEALEVYRDARTRLMDEIGIEPDPELRDLERRVLSQDPSLASPVAGEQADEKPRRRPRRRVSLALAGVAIASAVAVTATVLLRDSDRSAIVAAPNSVAMIDPRQNAVVGVVPLGERPTRIAVHGDDVWVLHPDRRTISHISRSSNAVLGTVGVDGAPSSLAADARGVWISDARNGRLTLIEPERLTVAATVRTRRRALLGPYADAGLLTRGYGSLWYASGEETIVRVDPRLASVTALIHDVATGEGNGAMAVGERSVWVAGPNQLDPLARIDPRSNRVIARIPLSKYRASGVAIGGGSVWVSDVGEDKVWRIDPARNIPVGTVSVGAAPIGVASGHGAIWVANSGDGTVSRIDALSGKVTRTITVGGSPNNLAVTDDAIWVTVA
jgi:YVTN family beta-propeller protein